MKINFSFRAFLLQCLCLLTLPFASPAQNRVCDATTLQEFFDCYGGQAAFSAHSIAAVSTFIQADDAMQAGNYAQAKTLVDNLFNTYQAGSSLRT